MLTSDRGRVLPPDLDDRQWTDIVAEARALIPKYAPKWTDHNPSDLGIALIELFSYLVEGLIYRLNRVPEKNYVAFLNLLGIKRNPATPARAWLTFSATPAATLVPAGTQAQTQPAPNEQPIVFETDDDLLVLPTNLTTALQIGKAVLNKYTNVSSAFTVPPSHGELLTVPIGQSVQLCLGFDAPTTAAIRLRMQFFSPLAPGQATVTFLHSQGVLEPSAWPAVAPTDDGTSGLTANGDVLVTIPAGTWDPQAPSNWTTVFASSAGDAVTTPLYWIGIRIANLLPGAALGLGINFILFNAASSHNALTIPLAEALGQGNGTPFQVFSLAHAPLFKKLDTDTPYDHLVVQVGGVTWGQVDDFLSGPGNFYRLDPIAGEVSFGNYDPAAATGNGSIPPTGAAIVATTYRWVAGGASGNVGGGAVNVVRTPVAGVNRVVNLFSAYDGADEEPIEDMMRRGPEALRNRDRAVTPADYEYLAHESDTDVVIARCLPPRVHDDSVPGHWSPGDPWNYAGLDRSAGNVFMIVVADLGAQEARPMPPPELIREVQRDLDKRHDLTARMQVTGPRYLPANIVVTAFVWNRAIAAGLIAGPAALQLDMQGKIELFFHPTRGNLDGKGWQVGQHAFIADLFKFIQPPENIGFISTLTLAAGVPVYHSPPIGPGGPYSTYERPFPLSAPGVWVEVADYELICFGSHTVTVSTA